MKSFLTAILSLVFIMSMSMTAFAADVEINSDDLGEETKTTSETSVTYFASNNNTGSGGNGDGSGSGGSGDGMARDEEMWTVTVPATISADASEADVTVVGSFAASRTLTVTAPETVTLYLDGIQTSDYAVLTVNFNDIALAGNYKKTSVTAASKISVQDMSEIKFGAWSGTLTFTIEMSNTKNWVASDVLNN